MSQILNLHQPREIKQPTCWDSSIVPGKSDYIAENRRSLFFSVFLCQRAFLTELCLSIYKSWEWSSLWLPPSEFGPVVMLLAWVLLATALDFYLTVSESISILKKEDITNSFKEKKQLYVIKSEILASIHEYQVIFFSTKFYFINSKMQQLDKHHCITKHVFLSFDTINASQNIFLQYSKCK